MQPDSQRSIRPEGASTGCAGCVFFPRGLPEGFVRGVHLGSPEEERAPEEEEEEEGGTGAQGDGYKKPGAHSLEDLSHAFEGTKARRAISQGVYGRLPAFVLTAPAISASGGRVDSDTG